MTEAEREEIRRKAKKTAKLISMIISGLPCLLIAFAGYTFMVGCMMTSFLPLPTVNILAPWVGGIITILAGCSAYLEAEEKRKKKILKKTLKKFKTKKKQEINLKK